MFEYNTSNWGDLDDSEEQSMENSHELPEVPEVTVEEEKEFREEFDKLIPTRGGISTTQKSLSTGNVYSSNPTISRKTPLPEKLDRWISKAKILRSNSTNDMNKNAYRRKRRPTHWKDQRDQNKKNDTKVEKSNNLIGKPIIKDSSWADVVRCSN